jgi:hypothetical protein
VRDRRRYRDIHDFETSRATETVLRRQRPPCEGLWRQGGGYLSDLGENKRQIELPLVTFDTTGYPLPDQPDSRKEQEVAC